MDKQDQVNEEKASGVQSSELRPTPELDASSGLEASAFIEAALSPSGVLWREWFGRAGDAVTINLVNATAKLVIGERDIATKKYEALVTAAQKVLAGLNGRIEEADKNNKAVPLFDGIGDLYNALALATPKEKQ